MSRRPSIDPRARHGRAALAAVLAAALLPSPAVGATFAVGALPVSAVGTELGDRDSWSPLIAGDGRFVVFTTSASALLGRPANAAEYYSVGLVRKNLLTGAVDVVATPERRLRADRSLVAEAAARSAVGISDDGRWIAFGSTARLVDAVQSTVTPEVYVRDMTRPRSDSASYELVSALDGGGQPIRYSDRTLGSLPGVPGFSLSDDGRRALFITQTASNVADGGAQSSTPHWQVYLRDLERDTTRLVTRERDDQSAAGTPVATSREAQAPLAALSGDGTVVAWVGSDTTRQARFLAGEGSSPASRQLLWRDFEAAPTAPAGRVAGEADPSDPACPADAQLVRDERAVGPCYGPFAAADDVTATDNGAPQLRGLSDDGRRLLFSASSRRRPYDVAAHRTGVGFVADLTPGLPRKQAVAVAWSQPDTRRGVPLATLAGDGRHAAFSSVDDRFDALQPVGAFQAGELTTQNVFAVDLDAHTVERATTTPRGTDYALVQPGESNIPVGLSVSDDGAAIAFAAGDGNLFVGDVNDALDVQVVREPEAAGSARESRQLPAPPPPATVVEPPLTPLVALHPRIERVRVDRRGVATVRVRVPAAGRLTARAVGTVPTTAARRRSARVVVGADRRSPRRSGVATLRIAPSPAARRAVRSAPHRLAVSLTIRFASTGGESRSDQRYTLRSSAPGRRR